MTNRISFVRLLPVLAFIALVAFLFGNAGFGDVTGVKTGADFRGLPEVAYPKASMVIDVTAAPYLARGDGVHDDTDAIQRALFDMMGSHRLLYFPKGVYLISKTLLWSKTNSSGKDAWGKNFLCGQSAEGTVLRLKDGTFTNSAEPQSMMWCGGFGSADWFHNYVENLTFDVGKNNPGAIALQFYSNNSGAVRNCRFLADATSGSIGLDLGHRDMNGPLLVRNCEVVGFERGINTARAVNGQTFEWITLRNQTKLGFDNEGQAISVRGLLSENSVPAIRSYGFFCLVEAKLTGRSGAEKWPAVINYNGGKIYLRDIETSDYARAIGDVVTPDWSAVTRITGEDKIGSLGPHVREYCSQSPTTAFPASLESLRLPIEEPPAVPVHPTSSWANVDEFGADPTGERDSSAAIQKAMDSGASTIFFPGSYSLESTVTIPGRVERILGLGGMIDYFAKAKPDFRIVEDASSPLHIEHFAYVHGGMEIDTDRTIVFRSVADCDLRFGERASKGHLFFEDFVTHRLALKGQRVWARQLNVENEGTHIENDGGELWVLGYKTERGGTLLDTRGQGASEILGGFSYTTTAGKLAPMFVTDRSNVFAYFHEVCFNGDPFIELIREMNGKETKTLERGNAHTAPYAARMPK
ncbi:Pectate lyase superfamily protein [Pirellula sp. SH-Sr6A]|uniref:glycosyl hydrolase family 28-related protein n=1 Tax=Pirellula sp. SH-Sr6A TaxID=1632865 RepID=UPI00078E5D03|nr:glycosyl hydrolase family 28-related protein [Pirellula sp. SH-Sr6A]AMV31453.1 Pectate lyase superfamily protein [Pirellula sp. SH-Sr6A]